MDGERREWLQRVVEAAQKAIANLRQLDGWEHDGLIGDLEELRRRLSGELEAAEVGD